MEIDIIGLISACSYALDCIEAELVNIKNKHGKRVAYISVRMGQYFDLPEDALQDLAICALLHDNALTQYISEELQEHSAADLTADLVANTTNLHCIYGEQNLAKIPFKTDVTNAILYHHEHADGTGPFHKKWDEVPLSARIIHLADVVDIIGHSGAFETPREKQTFDWETCKNIADFFAQIVDYKSSFTSRHSIGVAEKAAAFAEYIGYDPTQVQKMYLAGALHDIGKMAIDNDILEKPDKLTDEEFSKMKNHAGYTYLILSNINDFEDIRDWAAFHHEKLNGKGYPFGKTAAELNEPERIMACIDIYQALTESRPYKQGFSHEKTCDILDDMADKGFIDAGIAQKIRVCFQNTTI